MSSTGLSTNTAAVLAYAGWWVTGAIFWFVERRDDVVRFHAVQATIAFGALAVIIALSGMLAMVSLSFLPWGFSIFATVAAVTWVTGVVLWLVSLWKVSSGDEWRMPLAATLADRLLTASATASS